MLRAAPPRAARPRLFLPAGTDPARAAALRAEGYATVAGLDPAADPAGEARRLSCAFLLAAAGPVALTAE